MTKPNIVCPICSKIFISTRKFKEHVARTHAVERAYKCNLCRQEFRCQSQLNLHVLSRHEGIRFARKTNFKCSECGYEMCTKKQWINHMRTHTGERPFKCTANGCGMEFKLELTLKNHIKYKHSDERPLKCKFPGCHYKAKTMPTLIGHMKVHSDDRPFACPNAGCSYRARERNLIKRHTASVHSEAKTFACSKCDFKAARSDSLKTHSMRHHSESIRRDFKCSHPQCTESFRSSFELRRHFSNRHDERNIQCDHPGCVRKFGNANALNKHKWSVHSKKSLTCPSPNCSYRASTARRLESHMIVHNGRNEKIPCSIKDCQFKGKNDRAMEGHMRRHETLLKCPVSGCSRYVFSKKALNNHIKLHNPSDRPFQCPFCFKHYTTRDQLKIHSVVHTKEKAFMCGHCKYGSFSRGGVQGHIHSVHSSLEFPFIVLALGDRECLHCEVTLPLGEFIVHSMGHAVPIVAIERLEIK